MLKNFFATRRKAINAGVQNGNDHLLVKTSKKFEPLNLSKKHFPVFFLVLTKLLAEIVTYGAIIAICPVYFC